MAQYNTVRLATYGMPSTEVERVCNLPIKPGILCHLNTDGTIIPETATWPTDGTSPCLIAVENTAFGKTPGLEWNDNSQDYSAGSLVTCYSVMPGDKIWAWLVAGSPAVRIGEEMHPWGFWYGFGGTLERYGPNIDGYVATANENIDNSAGLVPVRIEVIII